MWQNYLKIAFRQMRQRQLLSGLKIVGLGLGIAASILLIQYISWQGNFDHFHNKRADIVRIQHDQYQDGVLTQNSAMTYAGVAVAAKESLPQVKNYVRVARWIANDVIFSNGEKVVRASDFFFTDPSFFDIFSFKLLQGDPKTALSEPNSIVLTASKAKVLFGDETPLGKEVSFESRQQFKVTGVVQDPPAQSHLQFSGFGSLNTMTSWGLDVYGDDQFQFSYVYAYLQLTEHANREQLAEDLTNLVAERKTAEETTDVFHLQNLTDIHLYSELQHEMGSTGQGNNMWILYGIAVLILVLGWVNHFNIFSAIAIEQAQALSVRKILGASRQQLFVQLSIAAFAYSFLSLVGGIALAEAVRPILEQSFDVPFQQLSVSTIFQTGPAASLIVLIVVGTLASAFLPALTLSSIRPITLLSNRLQFNPTGISFRKALVTFQFTIIIALIAAGVVIFQQTKYMQQQPLGLVLEDVVAIRGPLGTSHYQNLYPHFQLFKQELQSYPEILEMGASRNIPGDELERVDVRKLGDDHTVPILRNVATPDFFDVYKMPFLARDTSVTLESSEQMYVVINKMAAELLGFVRPEDALRQKLTLFDWELEVIGVVDNHHQRSLHHPVVPILFDLPSGEYAMEDGYYSIKLNETANTAALLPKIQAAYQRAFPSTFFDPIDVQNSFAAQYQGDNNFKQLNLVFTALGLIIACLGLLGLFMLLIEKRIKEIGIRKVLGASVTGIVLLLSKDFLKLILIALVLATPIAYFGIQQWLDNFAYRIEIQWWVFALAGVLAIGIAFLTVSVQSMKAALANPVESLRNE